MKFLNVFREGLRQASRRSRLVVLLYLVPLIPALGLAILATATLSPVWTRSLFAQDVLSGSWFGVWRDFAASPENHMPLVLGPALVLAFLATVALQVLLAAGVIPSLFGHRAAGSGGFVGGLRQFAPVFFRSLVWFALGLGFTAVACGAVVRGFFKLAENQADARWDLVGLALAFVVFGLLYVPLRGAYDLSRMAAVRHGDRKTLRGFVRALGAVLRHPLLFYPLYASFFLTVLALHGAYGLVRSGFTVKTWLGIAALALAQQVVMMLRAFLRLGFLAAGVEAFGVLGEARYCQAKVRTPASLPVPPPVEDVFP